MSGNRAESFLNADYIKLRDVSLTIDLPQSFTSKLRISSGQVSLVGSNLWILTRIASIGDDPSWLRGEGTTTADLKSPTSRSFGLKFKLIF
jgi:hypothetical protein